MNRFGAARRPFFKLNDRLLWRLLAVVGNRHGGRHQFLVSVRIFRENFHDIAIGFAVGDLEYVFSGGEHFARNFDRSAEFQFRFLVPLVRHRWRDHAAHKRHRNAKTHYVYSDFHFLTLSFIELI